MSSHKNTPKTAFDDVTGDTIHTGKCDPNEYAEWSGFDGGVQVPLNVAVEGSSVSFEFPSAVMALDFHDRGTSLSPTGCLECGHVFEVCLKDMFARCPECSNIWEQD